MHGRRRQDSMNTFADEKAKEEAEAVNPLAALCLTDSIVLVGFVAAEDSPPCRRRRGTGKQH